MNTSSPLDASSSSAVDEDDMEQHVSRKRNMDSENSDSDINQSMLGNTSLKHRQRIRLSGQSETPELVSMQLQEIRWMAIKMFSNISILFCHHPLHPLQLLLLLQRGKSELEIFMKEEMVTETELGDDQEGGWGSRGAEVFQLGETGVGMTREGSLVLIIFFGK